MRFSPRTLIGLAAVLTTLVALAAVLLALSTPRLGVALLPGNDGKTLQVASVEADSPNRGHLEPGQVITAFIHAGSRLAATPLLLVEEPDGLPTFADYNAFMAAQSQLAAALAAGRLEAELDDGRRIVLATRGVTPGDLPFLFWFQVFVGVSGVLTGALVWALGPRQSTATRLYLLTGLGYLVFAPAAGVYSTRELALDGDVLRALSVVNHFGALFFTASLTSLLWMYPRRLGRAWAPLLTYGLASAVWLLDASQASGDPAVFHLGVLLVFSGSFVFAGMQWWQTRQRPDDRAALRWFLLSIYLATGLFAAMVIIPSALKLPLPAPQGVMFGAFLIMYWGLALGVVRYRLFQIEAWWYAVWAWFLGGVAVVLVDILLLSLLAVPDGLALSLSVAIVGWLYFPVRQRLWAWLGGGRRERGLEQWLPEVLPLLIQPDSGNSSEAGLRDRWPAVLAAVYRPLRVVPVASQAAPAVADNGLGLLVPDLRRPGAWLCLQHAGNGERLFTPRDLATLDAVQRLFALALDMFRARDTGARLERERIARDIHDDLGARLLTLLHRSDESLQPLVREAIGETRSLLGTLSQAGPRLDEAIANWRVEIGERADALGVTLAWDNHCADASAVLLSARQYANLTRILREAVSNALRHSGAGRLEVVFRREGGDLLLRVGDDGCGLPALATSGGRGLAIMRSRAIELEGQVEWRAEGGCVVEMRLPLPVPGAEWAGA